MAPSQLRRYIVSRGEQSWFDAHFPRVELPSFAMSVLEGAFFSLLSVRTWFMVLLTVVAIFCCSPAMLNLDWKVEMGIVALGTVFPLVFAISSAFQSRNKTVHALGQLKARIMFLYHHLKGSGSAAAEPFRNLSSKLMTVTLESLISNNSGDECYDAMAELVETTVKICKVEGLCTPKLPLDVTRTVQEMVLDFEVLRENRVYETPKGLRHVSIFLICTLPVLLAPFWLSFCDTASGGSVEVLPVEIIAPTSGNVGSGVGLGLEEDGQVPQNLVKFPHGCVAAYFTAAIFVVVTFSLIRVQEALEDPFDGLGEDDIRWDVWSKHLDMVELHGPGGKELRDKAKAEEEQERTVG